MRRTSSFAFPVSYLLLPTAGMNKHYVTAPSNTSVREDCWFYWETVDEKWVVLCLATVSTMPSEITRRFYQ